nr:hypothetical protein [Streptomyces albus]
MGRGRGRARREGDEGGGEEGGGCRGAQTSHGSLLYQGTAGPGNVREGRGKAERWLGTTPVGPVPPFLSSVDAGPPGSVHVIDETYVHVRIW